MKPLTRIEHSLAMAISMGEAPGCPPKLAGAVRHAVFPGGARVRPRLCLAVAAACGDDDPVLSDATATSIELLHCASLVHDDLPCFDNAATRRGRASVQYAWGESLAVLAGDALIILAFQTLAAGAAHSPLRLPPLMATVATSVGMPFGAVAGQAWESEPRIDLGDYQRAKTGALFAAATMGGAQSAGADPGPWRAFGDWLGEAYQAADDIRDVVGDPRELGKPVGRDLALLRPSTASELGLEGAIAYFDQLVARAIDAVPECLGADGLRALVRGESERLVPRAPVVADLLRAAA
ncbi:polyprenyl synthetase family protein [Variovorax sp. J22R133]|uniref:polyprenyl synthetase family protein n=1 Tax=Variovorax brevis TaxID=3053503 RepID=UPI0025780E5B|nr:polyprenyl synthetase family protein [Variovorax sp. J22R133]MDM0113790.1 polyprenyl synthetase family protein [Variovorax sp. J22R133]